MRPRFLAEQQQQQQMDGFVGSARSNVLIGCDESTTRSARARRDVSREEVRTATAAAAAGSMTNRTLMTDVDVANEQRAKTANTMLRTLYKNIARQSPDKSGDLLKLTSNVCDEEIDLCSVSSFLKCLFFLLDFRKFHD